MELLSKRTVSESKMRMAHRLAGNTSSRLVSLRHHPSVWLVPAALLTLALLPWPYGYYTFLRFAVSILACWLAYEQWKFDDSFSGWVVVFGGVTLLYNPLMPIYFTREIWGMLNLGTAFMFLWHLASLRKMTVRPTAFVDDPPSPPHELLSSNAKSDSSVETANTDSRTKECS